MSSMQQGVQEARQTEVVVDRIERHVRLKTHGQVRNLTVTVRSGVAYLEGECRRYYTKQLATQAALEAGVELDAPARFKVHNEIEPTFRAWGRGISPELYSSEDDQDTPYGSMSTPSRRRISCAAWGTSS